MIGLPLGILMAKRKDTWVDSLGNAYVVLIMAVPGLAYMLMLKAVGNKLACRRPSRWTTRPGSCT